MRNLMRLSVIVLLCFGTTLGLRAADAPNEKSGSAMAEFKKIQAEYNSINAELRILQLEYRKADKANRAALEKKWKVLFQKGEEMQPKFFQSAEKAYVEAPNADKSLGKLLWNIFGYEVENDDNENAFRLAKLLIDNGNEDIRGFALAAAAAVTLGDFKTARDYYARAKKADLFKTPPAEGDKPMQNAVEFAQNLAAYEKKWDDEQKIRETEAKADDLPRVLIKTNKGDIVVELFENEAPNTVANFISLVEKKFYDGLTFHRVLPGFMAQGGDPKGDGSGDPGYKIPDEVANPNHRNHFRGSLSMAKSQMPDSGGSQFFLCFVPTPSLDGKHTVFGRIISGFEVLAKIQRCNPQDPDAADPDKILKMEVPRKREHEYKVKKTGE